MPWDDTARCEYRRETDRYASDLTDCEWELVAPFMPPLKRVGRPCTVDLREVVNALLYMASTGTVGNFVRWRGNLMTRRPTHDDRQDATGPVDGGPRAR